MGEQPARNSIRMLTRIFSFSLFFLLFLSPLAATAGKILGPFGGEEST